VRWKARALGKSAWQYWELVQARPGLTARALGALRGVGAQAAQRQLAKLAKAGLAVKDDVDRSWWPGSTLPDEAAEKVGIAGAGKAQHARHVVEREARREHLLQSRQIRGRCDAGGELIALEIAFEFDGVVAAAARVLPGAWWDRRRHVWVVPLNGLAAVALVQFAQMYGFEMTAAVQAAIDNTGDIKAPGRRDEGSRAR